MCFVSPIIQFCTRYRLRKVHKWYKNVHKMHIYTPYIAVDSLYIYSLFALAIQVVGAFTFGHIRLDRQDEYDV